MDAVSISLLVLAAVFLIGVGSRALFARTGIPEVLPLVLLGVLLGPVFGVLDRALLLRAAPHLGAAPAGLDPYIAPTEFEDWIGEDARRGVRLDYVATTIDLDEAPASTPDAYLRLHLLSHLLVTPNSLNLDGIFGHLPIVAWTTAGPMLPSEYARRRPLLQRAGISLHGIDKFPRMIGQIRYHLNRWRGKQATIIEYKPVPAERFECP